MLCPLLKLAILAHFVAECVHASQSFLSDNLVRKGQVQNVLEHEPVKVPSCQQSELTGPIETTMCDYETIESVNEELFNNLSELVHTPFFKYFQADLYRECPFWPDEGSCSDPGCAITTIDESDVPLKWRASTLSKVDPSTRDTRHELPGCYYRDSDFCWLDDNTEGDYYDLRLIPERYTGYSGKDAARVWRSIYEENCESASQCLEKRVYYKVISGLHASISTHICHEYLNQTTGEWVPNLECFIWRVASHPERLQYIYFDAILLLRAVARLGPYLKAYDYCSTGNHEDDAQTLKVLSRVISIAQEVGKFDETVLFRGENANVDHFRNVTRIMDCVGCDKCRLWGKVQTTGIATALKILFELDETALDPHSNSGLLQRSEVVAMMNTLFRFSESLVAVDDFRKLWKKTSAQESEKLINEAEQVAQPQASRTESSGLTGGSSITIPIAIPDVQKEYGGLRRRNAESGATRDRGR
ncbi:endoplasmic oxidoreductin-1 [Cyathus striatus]|nr:endoplasmic oxidoreductin-1 [Cyathus striatus]